MDNKLKLITAFKSKQPGSNTSKIAREYGVKRTSINYYQSYFDFDYGDNKHIQHQMLLGSKIGDGYFQKTKNGVYKFRESHSVEEKEYAIWKYMILDKMTDGVSMISKNNGEAVEIYTNSKSTNTIKKYYNMTIDDVLEQIDIYGLLIWILDDGWYNNHSKAGNIIIGSTILTCDQKEAIIDRFNDYHITARLNGQRKDISVSSEDNFILWSYLNKMMFTMDLDVITKKFGDIYNQI